MYSWFQLYTPYVALLAIALAVVALAWGGMAWRRLRLVEHGYRALTAGTQGGTLEAILDQHLENVRAASERASAAKETAIRIERAGRCHVQHVAIVRYNPFSHTGGDQSFVLVLADADGNGAIVNSLHARDGTRIYAKPLAAWESIYALTDEEQSAISKAQAGKNGSARN